MPRQIFAEFIRDNGSVQEVNITNVGLEWVAERMNQISALRFSHDLGFTRVCMGCGTSIEDLPNWMRRCSTCFNK